MRDCTAYLREAFADRATAECARVEPHTLHAGLDADGGLHQWRDTDDGAARG